MKNFLLILLLFPILAEAHFSDLSSLLSIVADEKQVAPSAEACSDEEAHVRCALELCGPPSSVPALPGFKSGEAAGANVTPPPPEIRRRLNKVISRMIRQNRRTFAEIRRRLQNDPAPSLNLSPDERSLHERKTFHHQQRIIIDTTKPLAERVRIQSTATDPQLAAGHNIYIVNLQRIAATDPLNPAVIGAGIQILTPEEMRVQMIRDIDSALSRTGLPIDQRKDLLSLKKEIPASPADEIFHSLVPIFNTALRRTPETLCGPGPCQEAVRNYMTSRSARFLEQLERENSDPALPVRALASCSSAFSVSAERAAQNASMREKLPGMLERFVHLGMRGTSEHSKEAFRKFFNKKIKPIFSETPENMKNKIIEFERRYKKGSAISQYVSGSFLIERFVKDEAPHALQELDICQSEFASQLEVTDAFAQSSKRGRHLNISPFSCTHQEYGENIIQHELGHALSDLTRRNGTSRASKAAFEKLRSCVNGFHTNHAASLSAIRHPGDTLHTEEDTADVISYRTATNDKLYSCAFLKRTPDNQSYDGLNLTSKTPHSAPLLRVLRESLYKGGEIPPSCRQLMNAKKQLLRFETCE